MLTHNFSLQWITRCCI